MGASDMPAAVRVVPISLIDACSSGINDEGLCGLVARIWPSALDRDRAAGSLVRYVKRGGDLNEPFLVILEDGNPVGITGVFRAPTFPPGVVGLRWSGVVRDRQERGIFKAALAALIEHVPGIGIIRELVPPDHGPTIGIFRALGFVPAGTINDPSDPHFHGGTAMDFRVLGNDL